MNYVKWYAPINMYLWLVGVIPLLFFVLFFVFVFLSSCCLSFDVYICISVLLACCMNLFVCCTYRIRYDDINGHCLIFSPFCTINVRHTKSIWYNVDVYLQAVVLWPTSKRVENQHAETRWAGCRRVEPRNGLLWRTHDYMIYDMYNISHVNTRHLFVVSFAWHDQTCLWDTHTSTTNKFQITQNINSGTWVRTYAYCCTFNDSINTLATYKKNERVKTKNYRESWTYS